MNAEQQTSAQVDHNSTEDTRVSQFNSGQEKKPAQTRDDQRKRKRMLVIFAVVLAIGQSTDWIVAPVAGIAMKRSTQGGSRVATGQQLLIISEVNDLWVTANFKETQLLHMRVGQRATIYDDSLDHDFTGSVDTIGGAQARLPALSRRKTQPATISRSSSESR